VRTVVALMVVGGLLLGLRYLAAALGARRPGLSGGRLLAVLESAMLPGGCSLHVVSVADRYLVIGRAASQLTLLCELSAAQMSKLAHSDRG
jgi:flagellar biogenesis protein FliO